MFSRPITISSARLAIKSIRCIAEKKIDRNVRVLFQKCEEFTTVGGGEVSLSFDIFIFTNLPIGGVMGFLDELESVRLVFSTEP